MGVVCSVGHREVGGGEEGERTMGGEHAQGSGAHETYQYPLAAIY